MMNETLTEKKVLVSIPWVSADKTGEKVFEVFIGDTMAAIRSNAHNPEMMEEIRKTLLVYLHLTEDLIDESRVTRVLPQRELVTA